MIQTSQVMIPDGIKRWAPCDRPREKLLSKGCHALSDTELLALVIGSGTEEVSAVELSRAILGSVSNNLAELGRLGVADLMRFKGIGGARASLIIAVMELGRRRRLAEGLKNPVISSSKDAFEIMQPQVADLAWETFWVLILNRGNRVKKTLCISEGSVSGTVADPKKIFKLALEHNASAIILCHNHPSGQVHPSGNDQRITRQCKEAGGFLDLPVLDHLVIGHDNYFSFADEGLL